MALGMTDHCRNIQYMFLWRNFHAFSSIVEHRVKIIDLLEFSFRQELERSLDGKQRF